MAVRPILRMGDVRLLEVSEAVSDPTSDEIKSLLNDMLDTMEANHGAGLAAPQIGVFKRIVIFGCESNPRYPDMEPIPFTILINPEIEILDEEVTESWEGCLSVPGMRGLVPRYNNVRYRGVDDQNNPIDRTVTGFHAIVVQHECDHLDGILYPMRMPDMAAFGFEEELAKAPESE